MNTKLNNLTSIIAAVMIALFILIGAQSAAKAQGNSEINQQLAQVRRATAKYHDVTAAMADGFSIFGGNDQCVEYPDGVSGITYANLDRIRQQGVVLEEPELLFYVPSGNGNLRLVAVAYYNRAFYIDTRGIIPGTFVSRLDPLPSYFQEVSGPFEIMGQTAGGPLINPGVAWFYALRVWVWSPNPNGMFVQHNPRLNCTANN